MKLRDSLDITRVMGSWHYQFDSFLEIWQYFAKCQKDFRLTMTEVTTFSIFLERAHIRTRWWKGGVSRGGCSAPSFGHCVILGEQRSRFGQRYLRENFLTLNDWSRGEQWILLPKKSHVSRDKVEENTEIRGIQNLLLPMGPIIKWLL